MIFSNYPKLQVTDHKQTLNLPFFENIQEELLQITALINELTMSKRSVIEDQKEELQSLVAQLTEVVRN